MKILFVVAYAISMSIPMESFSQSQPSKEVRAKDRAVQKYTNSLFIVYLEEGKIDQAKNFFTEEFKNEISIDKLLVYASNEMKLGLAKGERNVSLIHKDNHNIYRCSYKEKETHKALFRIKIHYEMGNPNSKVIFLETADAAQLKKERDEHNRLMREQGPPPPPPPPPGWKKN